MRGATNHDPQRAQRSQQAQSFEDLDQVVTLRARNAQPSSISDCVR